MRVPNEHRRTPFPPLRTLRRRTLRGVFVRVVVVALLAAAAPALGTQGPAAGPKAYAATSCPAAGCLVTVDARDFGTATPLPHFNYLINVDNTRYVDPGTRRPVADFPDYATTESHSPVVREGNESRPAVRLPAGRYLISVRAPDHKMWGQLITLPNAATADGAVTARVDLTLQDADHPQPLGKIRVFVFEDNAWTNGAPDTEEAGLQGFQVGLEEQTGSAVTVDYNNSPLCGGVCRTNGDGFVQLDDLGPATYFIDVHPPDQPCNDDPNSRWYQTTTIDGGLQLQAGVEEGSDGTGAPGEQLWEPPNARTAYWFGFVCSPTPFSQSGTGEITGTARNWQGWPPFDVLTLGDAVANPFVALSDASTDRTVYIGQGDSAGNFDIQNVPAGSYNLAVWDEQLSYIIRIVPVTIGAGETVAVGDEDPVHPGEQGLGVSRWFGWLDGDVYKDLNGNGVRDAGEPGVPNTDMDQRWRDGSIKEGTFTGPTGHYEYPTAEGGALGKWIINEQGFARFDVTGAAVHDEHDGSVTHVPADQGGALLTNQLLTEGHRATVDWGKRDYPAGTPGQIVGVTYLSTTRNEFDARFQAHEDYEPGIPDVTVYLETAGPDNQPNTADDIVVNKYVTDHWQHPNSSQTSSQAGWSQACAVLDAGGADISGQLNPAIGPACLETPINGEQTKDGAFDGGYAFADYCPSGYDLTADDGSCVSGDPQPLVAGTYITHVEMPADTGDTRSCNPAANGSGFKKITGVFGDVASARKGCLYRPVREEDVNVDLGRTFTPAIPPPPCTGDDHVIDQSTLVARSNYFGQAGAHAPLCDKRLVVLQNGQNANADFNLMTNFETDPNGENPADDRIGDVAPPGRLIGLVSNDIYFERNNKSMWYGEPRPIGGIPIGIYQRVDTVPNAATNGTITYDGNVWRLFTTVYTNPEGGYEALLPSTETFNCPIPQGPCPGMYLVKVDDPGSKAAPNPGYDPNLLTATSAWDVWPGLTDQLDTPLDPISGTGCEDPAVPARPELLQVSSPVVPAAGSRQVTVQADFIGSAGTATGATGVRATLTDHRNGQVQTLTRANGGIANWVPGNATTPDRVVLNIPALASNAAANLLPNATFRPGPKQLTLTTSNANGGVSTVNGITLHVLGSNGTATNTVAYNPNIVNVNAPSITGPNAHALQNAVDAAPAGSLLVLKAGVYNENVLVWKPLKIQGLGPGGITGAHEQQARDPEDPRFHVVGTIVDGRYFPENAGVYDGTVSAHAPYAGVDASHPVLRGADLTAVAQSATAYNLTTSTAMSRAEFSQARIDGIALSTGQGEGAGGVQLQASINNMQLTNNVLENNGGVVAGGIGVGQPYAHASHNYNVRIANDRVLGNGGLTQAGGIGLFYGSNAYTVANNIVCSNFSVNYGAGVSHIGLSPGGSIRDNQIYYNDSVDSGAGVAIESELPVGGGSLGDGTGTVSVDRNLIQSNYSGDDGGGMFVLDALDQAITVRDNQLVDNGAADIGGAIMLDDSSNVRIVNNTVANNVSTASSENSALGAPHSAGLAAEGNDSLWQGDARYAAQYPNAATRPDFSNPTALFNNIFWNNNAFTLDSFGPGAGLVNQGFIDFEIHGTTNNADTFTPRYSDLTNGQIMAPDGSQHAVPGGQGNLVGVDPGFVTPFTLELTVSGSRLDPQTAAVTITGADPPVGLTGNYHLQAVSAVVDRGVRCSNTPAPAPATALNPCTAGAVPAPTLSVALGGIGDYDGDYRPMLRTIRVRTPWDLGADELPGVPVPLAQPLQAVSRPGAR